MGGAIFDWCMRHMPTHIVRDLGIYGFLAVIMDLKSQQQQQEDVERKWEYYLIIFPEWT